MEGFAPFKGILKVKAQMHLFAEQYGERIVLLVHGLLQTKYNMRMRNVKMRKKNS
jgi:hypothetical protein